MILVWSAFPIKDSKINEPFFCLLLTVVSIATESPIFYAAVVYGFNLRLDFSFGKVQAGIVFGLTEQTE